MWSPVGTAHKVQDLLPANMTFLATANLLAALVSATDCTPVPLYRSGQAAAIVCAESPHGGTVVLDLGDDWAPRLFSETPEQPQTHRSYFLALANERPGTTREWDTARRDRYYELFGIFPSIGVIRNRISDEARHACHAAVDSSPLTAVRDHLRCEGLITDPVPARPGSGVERTALAIYQRRHMIPAGGRLDDETRTALATDSRELDFRTLLRALRERVVDATGLIEDGSAANAWEPVLGRHLEPGEYRTILRATPLARGAPDLIARATETAAVALGWTSPEAAEHSLQQGIPARIAIRWQPPAYHQSVMQLRAEIDRGDVWAEPPIDASGRPRRSPVRRRPTLALYAVTVDGEIPLVRWPTTIGGWQPEKLADGSVTMEYKPSPVGRRHWRDLLATPAWFPPPSTPDRELVRRSGNGTWTTDDDAVGPGYRSAYGLMALLHHRASEVPAASSDATGFIDAQIRSHGSGNYRSILRGSSHGCHRLFNHLAIRLGSFLLAHHQHVRHGEIRESYARRISWKGRSLVLRARTRGYRYELTPPVPVDVLPGRTVRSRPLESVSHLGDAEHAPDDPVDCRGLIGRGNPTRNPDDSAARLDSHRLGAGRLQPP
jgi:hypothetical protein